MNYKKCPRCDLNYIKESESYCKTCIEELKKLNRPNKIYYRPTNTNIDISFSDTDSFYSKCFDEIEKEIIYLKKDKTTKSLYDGSFIGQYRGRYYYVFETDTEVYYQDNTALILFDKIGSISGEIISCDGNSMVFCSTNELSSESLSEIKYIVDPVPLLNSLIERLTYMKQSTKSRIVNDLILSGDKNIEYGKPIVIGSDNAIQMAKNQSITFIWGPPGTGKTRTLSNIALEEMNIGHRVLIVSHSNIAVDGAVVRIDSINKNLQAGQVVRYGYPRDVYILKHEYLSSYNLALHSNQKLLDEKEQLIKEQLSINKNDLRYLQIQERLSSIKRQIAKIERMAVDDAKIVATTISKAVVDNTIYESKFDAVIFDEASMAYIPQIFFAASLATKHFVCVGDFLQLPPIVPSGNNFLKEDVFSYCKIKKAVDYGASHAWLCMLNIQHRMQPDIASFISKEMYRSLLKSSYEMRAQTAVIMESSPIKGIPLSIVDTDGMMTVCRSALKSSSLNPLSALLTIGLALSGAADNEVGIITPYNAQSRLLKAMAKDVAVNDPSLKKITCATVHSYQGAEKDIILYDTVDCYRNKYASGLITSKVGDYANRLFNVAVTRAKGKFVLVGNMYFFKSRLTSDLLFYKLYHSYCNSKNIIGCRDLLKNEINKTTKTYSLFDVQNGNNAFINDINNAKKEVAIYIPNYIDEKNCNYLVFVEALKKAKNRGVNVFIIAENWWYLPKELKKFARQEKFVYDPVSIIDRKITWFGEPISKAYFKIEGGRRDPEVRPIIRFLGENTAKVLHRFFRNN